MADKTIGSLPAAPDLYDDSLLAVEQQGQAVKLTGAQIKGFARQGVSQYVQAAQDAASEALEAVGKVGDSVEQAQTAAQTAQEYSGKPPVIQDGTWWTWNAEAKAYQDTGKPAQGPQGEQGIQGIQGPEGKQGPIGPQGQPGADGTSFVVKGRFDTLAELESAHPAGQTGDAYAVGTPEDNTVYLWSADAQAWQDVGSLQGPEGPEGKQGPVGPQGPPGSTEAADAAAQAAQAAAEQAAAAAAAKQDKLTGTAGQVVGFNAEGVAEARSAVLSFKGRTGAVTPQNGDYSVGQVTGAAPKASPVFTGSISLGRTESSRIGSDSFAVGGICEASGSYSHAEGYKNAAIGLASHVEGGVINPSDQGNIAGGNSSHAEGATTSSYGLAAHTEGTSTTVAGVQGGHAEGMSTIAASPARFLSILQFDKDISKLTFDSNSQKFSTAFSLLKEGVLLVLGSNSNSFRYRCPVITVDDTNYSVIVDTSSLNRTFNPSFAIILSSSYYTTAEHAEGAYTQALADCAHAEGMYSKASGSAAHAEGWSTEASGGSSHAEGYETTASGSRAHAEGEGTAATHSSTHAEGFRTTASAHYAHAEGRGTIANGDSSHAEGYETKTNGVAAHAEGKDTVAAGYCSHTAGYGTIANFNQFVIGRYNVEAGTPGGSLPQDPIFIIGKGGTSTSRSNAFRVTKEAVYGGSYSSSGADYAELFEWMDGNLNAEDRAGLFVTLEGERLRVARPEDDFVLGIVSADPSVVGDVYDDQWAGMYLRDVFGRTIMEMQDFPAETTQVPREDGTMETVELIPARRELAPKLNPAYDHTVKYLPRTQRPEWDAVGMMGKLVAVDDGTCQVNGWCAVGEGGKATHSDARTRYRVMARLDDTHIRVLIL